MTTECVLESHGPCESLDFSIVHKSDRNRPRYERGARALETICWLVVLCFCFSLGRRSACNRAAGRRSRAPCRSGTGPIRTRASETLSCRSRLASPRSFSKSPDTYLVHDRKVCSEEPLDTRAYGVRSKSALSKRPQSLAVLRRRRTSRKVQRTQ